MRPKRSAIEEPLRAGAERQRTIDALLPAFLLPAPDGAVKRGSLWTNLADLALSFEPPWNEEDQSRVLVGYAHDLAVPGMSQERVLPRGSRLRLLEPFYEMWNYGYLAGVFFDLAVETGVMAGRTVTVSDYGRRSWANGVSRGTLAAALIVPADAPDAETPGAGLHRYDNAIAVLRDAGVPVTRTDGFPVEPLTREGDLDALV